MKLDYIGLDHNQTVKADAKSANDRRTAVDYGTTYAAIPHF